MAQYWWQPDPDDIGTAPSDLAFTSMFDGVDSVVVAGDYLSYGDPTCLRLVFPSTTSVSLRGISIDSIYGVDVTSLSNEVEIFCHFRNVGANSDGFAASWTDPSSPYPLVTALRSRNSSDFMFALRRFTSNTNFSTIVGTSSGQDYNRDNNQVKARVGFSTTFARGKMWFPVLNDNEPAGWDLDDSFPGSTPTSGRIAFGRRRHVSDQNFSLNIFGFGIGTDGDPAPTGPVVEGLPTLTDAALVNIQPAEEPGGSGSFVTPQVGLLY